METIKNYIAIIIYNLINTFIGDCIKLYDNYIMRTFQ